MPRDEILQLPVFGCTFGVQNWQCLELVAVRVWTIRPRIWFLLVYLNKGFQLSKFSFSRKHYLKRFYYSSNYVISTTGIRYFNEVLVICTSVLDPYHFCYNRNDFKKPCYQRKFGKNMIFIHMQSVIIFLRDKISRRRTMS